MSRRPAHSTSAKRHAAKKAASSHGAFGGGRDVSTAAKSLSPDPRQPLPAVWLRSRVRQHQESLEESAAESLQAHEPDWAEIRAIGDALARLPDEQRAVMLLVGLEQFTYDEAARILKIPVGTVMSRLSRGRERLRALIGSDPKPRPLKAVK